MSRISKVYMLTSGDIYLASSAIAGFCELLHALISHVDSASTSSMSCTGGQVSPQNNDTWHLIHWAFSLGYSVSLNHLLRHAQITKLTMLVSFRPDSEYDSSSSDGLCFICTSGELGKWPRTYFCRPETPG